jgi:hypothetical protein
MIAQVTMSTFAARVVEPMCSMIISLQSRATLQHVEPRCKPSDHAAMRCVVLRRVVPALQRGVPILPALLQQARVIARARPTDKSLRAHTNTMAGSGTITCTALQRGVLHRHALHRGALRCNAAPCGNTPRYFATVAIARTRLRRTPLPCAGSAS